MMRITEKSKDEFQIAFQVVEDGQKPLFAVSSIVRQGHRVIFALENPHIFLTSGVKIAMRHVHGTYELDILVQKPAFIRSSAK